jgi:hypothetical protein
MWIYDTPLAGTEPLEAHLTWIADLLARHKNELADLGLIKSKSFSVSCCCWLRSNEESFCLPSSVVQRLAEFSVEIDFLILNAAGPSLSKT